MGKKVIVMALLVIWLVPAAGFAASPWTEEEGYANKAVAKLSFGLKNFLGAWTEIIAQPMASYEEEKNVVAGVARGLYNTVVYGVGGMLHVVTFPVTNLDVPLPDNGLDFE